MRTLPGSSGRTGRSKPAPDDELLTTKAAAGRWTKM